MLNREQIEEMIRKNGLVQGFPHLETQIQPNGFDITVDKIFRFSGAGKLDFSNSEREISGCEEIEPEKKDEDDEYGWWALEKGAYKVRTNERFRIPKDIIALAFPRSSLLRMGVHVEHGVWDAGFQGKAEFLLVVHNEKGIEIKENSRISQLIFIPIEKVEEGYGGIYND